MKPKEIKKGMRVDYHREIGGAITKRNCKVFMDPFEVGVFGNCRPKGSDPLWVTAIDCVDGWIDCNNLSLPEKEDL